MHKTRLFCCHCMERNECLYGLACVFVCVVTTATEFHNVFAYRGIGRRNERMIFSFIGAVYAEFFQVEYLNVPTPWLDRVTHDHSDAYIDVRTGRGGSGRSIFNRMGFQRVTKYRIQSAEWCVCKHTPFNTHMREYYGNVYFFLFFHFHIWAALGIGRHCAEHL